MTGTYKLVRVLEVFPDEKGLVRTVAIQYRRRDTKEKPEEIKAKNNAREKVGVQRLVLIHPARGEEDDGDTDKPPSDMEPSFSGEVEAVDP